MNSKIIIALKKKIMFICNISSCYISHTSIDLWSVII